MSKLRLGVVVLVVVGALASCSHHDSGDDDLVTTPAGGVSLPAHAGVLVPGTPLTNDGPDAPKVTVSSVGSNFRYRSSADGRSLDFRSTSGLMIGSTGVPLRCGVPGSSGANPLKGFVPDTVAGPSAKADLLAADGSRVAVVASSEPLLAHNPSGLHGLAADEITSSLFLTPGQLRRLLADIHASRTVEGWTHHFAGGLTVQATVRGSLARGFSYAVAQRAGREHTGATSTIAVLRCDQPSVFTWSTKVATYVPVLVSSGAKLVVAGTVQRDLVPDPVLQGAWAVVRVARGARAVSVETVQVATGKRLTSWRQSYEPPEAD